MNTKATIQLVGAAAMAALLGCSTPKPEGPVAAAPPAPPAPQFFAQYEMIEQQPVAPGFVPFGKICKLSTSCLAMDPRPFEPCLVSTKDCRDKAGEPMQVEQPEWSVPPPAIIKTTY